MEAPADSGARRARGLIEAAEKKGTRMISLSPWLLSLSFAVITLSVVAGFAITRAAVGPAPSAPPCVAQSLCASCRRASEEAGLLSAAGLEGSGLADAARAYIQDREIGSPPRGLDRRRLCGATPGRSCRVATRLGVICRVEQSVRLSPHRRAGADCVDPGAGAAWKRWMRRATHRAHATCIT